MPELLDQPDRLELAQRLADRCAADAEPGGQVFLAQAGAHRDLAGHDLDLQRTGQIVGAAEADGLGSGHFSDAIRGSVGYTHTLVS